MISAPPYLRHQLCSGHAPVPREPISIGIALITAVEAVTTVAIGFEVAAAVGYVALGAAVIGANYALAAINKPKPSDPTASGIGSAITINSPQARGNVQQSAPIQRWIYGSVRAGGAVSFIDDSMPPYLYLQTLLSARQISGIRGLHISVNDIKLSSFAFDQVLQPLAVDGQVYIKDGVSRLSMAFGAGRDDQAICPLLKTDFPNLDDSFRQRGTARATFRFKFGDDVDDFQRMWGQGVSIPSPLLDIDGMPVYDPRDPAQRYPTDWRDAEDVAEAMATWKFRRNGRDVGRTAALVQADWLGHPDGVNHPAGRIRWDEIARAADFDEERGHTIDGEVTLDQNPRTVMEAMLTANRGFVVQGRGYGWVMSSQPREPVITIDDDLLLGGFEFQADRFKSELANTVRSRFSSADREYQDVDGPVVARDDLIDADGEVFTKTVRMPFTSDSDQVQILANQYLDEARLKRSLVCNIKLRAIADGVREGEVVRVFSRNFPQINADYSIEKIGFLDDLSGLSLGLREYDASISTRPYALKPFTLPTLDVS
jgi:hypothetical protein